MTRPLGTASLNPTDPPDEGTTPQRSMGGAGEAAPNDQEHLQRLDYWAALNALRDEQHRLEET